MRPLIGITAGEIVNGDFPFLPLVHGQQYTYVDAICRAGGVPIILPLVEDDEVLAGLYERCDGLLLSSGNDIDPALYSAKPSKRLMAVSRRRDEQELKLIRRALADDKPLLGVCCGMQLLNVAQGGTLYQDIATEVPGASSSHHKALDDGVITHVAHNLRLDPGSKLAGILRTDYIAANAYHHQAIKKLGHELQAVAWAEDGVIEAVELSGKRFALGVQAHPEALEAKAEPRWRELFTAFVGAAQGAA